MMNFPARDLLSLDSARVALRARLNEPHIAPLTRAVIALSTENGRSLPFIDPGCGGTEARLLFVLESPGSGAKSSGFLSLGNPDKASHNAAEAMKEAGIDYGQVAFWNILPWPVAGQPRVADLRLGAGCLNRILPHLAKLRALVLAGRVSQSARPYLSIPSSVRVFHSPSPGPRAYSHSSLRDAVKQAYRDAWLWAQSA